MKKVLFLALILVASLQQVDAQRRGGKENTTPEQRVEQRMTKLSEELNLNDEQKEKIKALYLEFFQTKMEREERKSKMEELNKQIESVLTDEQQTKFKELSTRKK